MIIGAETFTEQMSRVRQMAQDRDGETWDLSDNDRAALEAVTVLHAAMLDALVNVCESAITVSDGCALCGCDLDATPPHYSGCAIGIAKAVIAKAEPL